jgi:hypothetical protein
LLEATNRCPFLSNADWSNSSLVFASVNAETAVPLVGSNWSTSLPLLKTMSFVVGSKARPCAGTPDSSWCSVAWVPLKVTIPKVPEVLPSAAVP